MVQRRIRRRDVFVHNMLVRLIVRTILDVLSETLPLVLKRLMHQHRGSDPIVRARQFDRWTEVLAAIYKRKRYRRPRVYPATERQLAALLILLREARVRKDDAAISALKRAINLLRH
jgi:hypothetical protein